MGQWFSLEGGCRLPYSGDNYRAYSVLGFLLGRTFVHSAVRNAMRDAYADLSKSHPELRFIYAETGWPWGGGFAPHKTHANGTSVDFHVPVRTLDGQVSQLPASPLNKFGYSLEFDNSGRSGSYRLDFEAMALHLLALDRAARANGIRIRRVIFDAASDGAHVIFGMLVVGLIFLGVVAIGELVRSAGHRRRARRPRSY